MRIFVGGVAALLAAAAIGCGSGGGDTTEVALTKAQFISRGDAICQAAQKKQTQAIDAWHKQTSGEEKSITDWTAEELGQIYLTVALPPIQEATDELSSLTPPAGDAKAEKVVSSMVSAVEAVEEQPLRAIKELPYQGADKLALAYGFKACGQF